MIRRTHSGGWDGDTQTDVYQALKAELRAVNLGAVESHKGWHDYAYGLSRKRLRPVVPDENYLGDTRIPEPVKPKPRKRRIRPVQIAEPVIDRATVRRARYKTIYANEPGVPIMPDDETPWWLDEDVLVSRNEDMISKLLDD